MTGKSLQLSKYGTAATADKQTSPTDATAGALMAVGAFGIGEYMLQESDTDYNLITGRGKYHMPSDQGSLNRPPQVDLSNLQALIEIEEISSTRIIQNVRYLRKRNAGVVAGETTFSRVYYENIGAWGAWTFNYHTGNILGTVGQGTASGDPVTGTVTGAIIERGSNSNGEYVKFADGTLINHSRGIVNQVYSAGDYVENVQFAHPFINTSYVAVSVNEMQSSHSDMNKLTHFAFRNSGDVGRNDSNVDVYFGFSANLAFAFRPSLVVTGRWF